MTSVLFVLSTAQCRIARNGVRQASGGGWPAKILDPLRIFSAAGWDVTVVAPDRTVPGTAPAATTTCPTADHLEHLEHPRSIGDVDLTVVDVVFCADGPGAIEDPASDELLSTAMRADIRLGVVGRRAAAALAFHHPGRNRASAGRRSAADLLAPLVSVDRYLYVGRTPAAAAAVARRLVADSGDPALRISVSRTVGAPPDSVYEVISDVDSMGQRSPETLRTTWLQPGKRFIGHNAVGRLYRWSTVCTITEATPGKRFRFHVSWPSRTTWSDDLTPVRDGTLITETAVKRDPQYAPIRIVQRVLGGVDDRAGHLRQGMHDTLDAVARTVESATPP